MLAFAAGAVDSPRGGPSDTGTGSNLPSCTNGDPGCNVYKSGGKSGGNGGTALAIAAVGGVAVVGILWYIFRAPPSAHFAGQTKLAEF